jgi:hypothetical protein
MSCDPPSWSDVPTPPPCTNEGRWERFWPGRSPDYVCTAHAEDTKAIGRALAIHIEVRPLEVDEVVPCSCRAGRVGTVYLVSG